MAWYEPCDTIGLNLGAPQNIANSSHVGCRIYKSGGARGSSVKPAVLVSDIMSDHSRTSCPAIPVRNREQIFAIMLAGRNAVNTFVVHHLLACHRTAALCRSYIRVPDCAQVDAHSPLLTVATLLQGFNEEPRTLARYTHVQLTLK